MESEDFMLELPFEKTRSRTSEVDLYRLQIKQAYSLLKNLFGPEVVMAEWPYVEITTTIAKSERMLLANRWRRSYPGPNYDRYLNWSFPAYEIWLVYSEQGKVVVTIRSVNNGKHRESAVIIK